MLGRKEGLKDAGQKNFKAPVMEDIYAFSRPTSGGNSPKPLCQ